MAAHAGATAQVDRQIDSKTEFEVIGGILIKESENFALATNTVYVCIGQLVLLVGSGALDYSVGNIGYGIGCALLGVGIFLFGMFGMRRASYDLLGAFVMCSGLLAIWILFMLFSYASWGCTSFNSCATMWANPVWCKTSDLFMWVSAVLHVGIGIVAVLGYLWGFKLFDRQPKLVVKKAK